MILKAPAPMPNSLSFVKYVILSQLWMRMEPVTMDKTQPHKLNKIPILLSTSASIICPKRSLLGLCYMKIRVGINLNIKLNHPKSKLYLPIMKTEHMIVNPANVPQITMASLEKMISSLILAMRMMQVTVKA